MSRDLILVGGGGHCRSCIDVIESEGAFRIAGIVDSEENRGLKLSGYEVIGVDADLPGLAKKGLCFLITLGQIKSPRRRSELFSILCSAGAALATIVSPFARVSSTARIGEGTIVMHHALVVAGAVIGRNCIINDKALVEHDARIGDDCHISTGAIVNGGGVIADRTFIGSGAVVMQGVSVPGDCVIGAGSLVGKSIAEPGTYAGNPLRKLAAA